MQITMPLEASMLQTPWFHAICRESLRLIKLTRLAWSKKRKGTHANWSKQFQTPTDTQDFSYKAM